MQNVELKIELRDPELARTICTAIGACWVATLKQTDTYYRIADAHLKRRECQGHPTEYVHYSRSNRAQARLSTFTIYPESMAKERFGTEPLPVWVLVKKTRDLFTSRTGVRIHMDHVEGLGDFLELEALVCPERTVASAHAQLEELRRALAPALGEPIACSYAELIAAEAEAV